MSISISQYSDAELFYQMKDDKNIAERAFGELYSRHSPRVFAYCRRILGDRERAQDAFQDTFVKFYQSAQQDRIMTNVPAFLLRIARNLCLNAQRTRHQTVQFEDYHASMSDEPAEKTELLKLITTALELLPDDYREAFVLREYDGLSYQEIAEITNSSMATVKIRLFRAKQKIRDVLAPYLADLAK
ncbi:MAG: RNA polymerase sigma factor [Ignavibacteria bacterium]|nr:RNA polymerase sigma factor [Ignavibacteria bacterium]